MMINAVIVTHNRKALLLRCISAVLNQTIPVHRLVIVDNASSDGTREQLVKKGYASETDGVTETIGTTGIDVIRLQENLGGAGGFHFGMQHAFQEDMDFMWIMDDDGYPAADCLERQLPYAGSHDYVMPVSLDTQDHTKLTWFIRMKNKKWTRSYKELAASFTDGIMPQATPFNGLLLSRQVIQQVGWPNKDMFIWGDDYEYQYRCIRAGYTPVTVLDAKFYHPEDKASHYRIFWGLVPVNYSESRLRFTCLIRNSTYNYWHYKGKHYIFLKFLIYSWFFLIYKRLSVEEYSHYLKCVMDGIKGDFSRHRKYLE